MPCLASIFDAMSGVKKLPNLIPAINCPTSAFTPSIALMVWVVRRASAYSTQLSRLLRWIYVRLGKDSGKKFYLKILNFYSIMLSELWYFQKQLYNNISINNYSPTILVQLSNNGQTWINSKYLSNSQVKLYFYRNFNIDGIYFYLYFGRVLLFLQYFLSQYDDICFTCLKWQYIYLFMIASEAKRILPRVAS